MIERLRPLPCCAVDGETTYRVGITRVVFVPGIVHARAYLEAQDTRTDTKWSWTGRWWVSHRSGGSRVG